jgi:hypothetical protein
MTVVSRTIRSIPHRSASDTWSFIVDLLAPSSGAARSELQSVAGIASALITEEIMTDAAMVVYGAGPRVRIYCLYNEDAIDGDKAAESALAFVPTDGDWSLSLPSPADDLGWVETALRAKSSRITARDKDTTIDESSSNDDGASALSVDKEAFLRL